MRLWGIITIAVLHFIILGTAISIFWDQHQEISRFEMYSAMYYNYSYERGHTTQGLYSFSKKFTCIWLKGRSYSGALETFNHEWLHHSKGQEHFNMSARGYDNGGNCTK